MIRIVRRNFALAISVFLLSLTSPTGMIERAGAEEVRKPEFQSMAPLEQYLMSKDEEIALARSAAPASISANAQILVLGKHGYDTAVKGTNGFACLVLRSWSSPLGDTEFWNAKSRSPICYNAAAAKTVLPSDLERTQWVLTGVSETEMRAKNEVSRVVHEAPAPGSMAYMMSKQQHLSDADGHWHPHLMLYQPHMDSTAWGANVPGSPVFALQGAADEATIFVVPLVKWSDGTPATDMSM